MRRRPRSTGCVLTERKVGADGRRAAPGRRAARPGRRGARRLDPPQRAAHPPGPGAARRGRRSSTRTGRTSRATPPACASSRATPPSCGARRAPSRSNLAIAARPAGGAWPRRACRPTRCVLVDDTRREAAVEFMRLRDSIDCLIPRGGPSLIRSILEHATVPYVIDGDGNCHVYVDETADLDMAVDIVVNAKMQRPSVLQRGRVPAGAPDRRRRRSCRVLAAAIDGVELVGDEAHPRARPGRGRGRRRGLRRPSSSTSSCRCGSSTRSTRPSTTSTGSGPATARPS